jgi:hypothetical protein
MENYTRLVSHGAPITKSNDSSSQSWMLYTLSALLAYPFLATSLRYRRTRNLESKYRYATRESYARMTDNEAFEIWNQMAELEFPTIFEKALQFALFRVRSPSPFCVVGSSQSLRSSIPNPSHRPTAFQPLVPCSSRPPSCHPQAQLANATPILAYWSLKSGATGPQTSAPLTLSPG